MKPIKIKIPEDHDGWLAIRQKGIGGSDAGAILGLNKYKSPYTLWAEKSGIISDTVEDNEKMRQGRDFEDYVARRFTEATGKKVKKSGYMYRHPECQFMQATVDRLVVGEKAGLECKTVGQFNRTRFDNGDIPPSYYCQCVHYLAVTGLDRWYICLLQFQKEPIIFCIERDEEEIQALIDAETEFWNRVITGTPPEIDGSKSTAESLFKRYPQATEFEEIVPLTDEEAEELVQLKQEVKDLEAKKEAAENRIKAVLGDHEKGESDKYIVTWKLYSSQRFDSKKFKADHPKLYNEYTKTSNYRKLEPSVKKGVTA